MKHITTMKKGLLFAVLCLSQVSTAYSQQTFINEGWNITNGILGQHPNIANEIDPDGNLVYLSNRLQGNNSDILLNCYNSNGDSLWQIICPSSPTYDDYGTALQIDSIGNIFVCGARNNGSDLDFWMAKYSYTGTLIWQQSYAGTSSGDDVPLSLMLDSNLNPIITGFVYNSTTGNDMATLKLDSDDGTILWSNQYVDTLNQESYNIVVDDNQDVVISGISSDSLVYGGIVVVKYNGQNGQQIAANDFFTSMTGLDIPRAMKKGNNDKIVIVGATGVNTFDSDILILYLDDSLQLTWDRTIDRDGRLDEALDFAINSSGEIIITGYTSKLSGGQEILVSKIDPSNGNTIWQYEKTALVDTDNVRGTGIVVDAQDKIYVTGTEQRNGLEQYLTMGMSNDGIVKWAQYYVNNNSTSNFADNIQINENNYLYVTGRSISNTESVISTVTYTIDDKEIVFVVDTLGNPTHIQGDLIVEFYPSHVDTATFDNRRFISGNLSDFVSGEMITALNNRTGMDWAKFPTRKVFKRATSADTLSVTRLGDTIRTSDFWTSVVIEIPEGFEETYMASQIEVLQGIKIATRNDLLKAYAAPNDVMYQAGQQLALHPNSIYPNSDMNVEGAWDIEVGQEFVKVGVYDNIIDWSNQEFGSTQTFASSKVSGGYNYQANTSIEFVNSNIGPHGTNVAGIIGAYRNDGLGIAGIAGGDLSVGNKGVQLYSMGISINGTAGSWAPMSTIKEAIIEGAIDVPNSQYDLGFGLHVQNHSWGTVEPNGHLKEAVDECWRNHCVFVAAIGNENNTTANYPASFSDRKVLNVIASGTDGERKNGITNGYSTWGSSYGWDGSLNYAKVEPDFMAPGALALNSTIVPYWNSQNTPGCSLNTSGYTCFNGSSASAANVSGVVALMYSKHIPSSGFPNFLSTEDIEEILQNTAEDRDISGYDYQSGYGLVNAEEALLKVSDPYYVVHKRYDRNDATYYWVGNGVNVFTDLGVDANNNPAYAYYDHVDAYRFQWVIDETLPAGHAIEDTWNLEAGWKVGNNQNLQTISILSIEAVDKATVNLNAPVGGNHVTGYAHTDLYLVTENPNTPAEYSFWFPFHPDELKFAYSIHVNSNPTLALAEEQNSSQMILFPNPSNGNITVTFDAQSSEDVQVKITDAMGRVITITNYSNIVNGSNSIVLDISSLQDGVYYCTLDTANSRQTTPFVKSN